jgi:ssDNA-binding Zn-finger/Zn-ribbon topoisomerase 1
MVEKDGRFGKFWGCVQFPRCRGSRQHGDTVVDASSASLTPLMDHIERERKMLVPSLARAPRATALDAYFLGVAEKHGIDFFDDDGDDF